MGIHNQEGIESYCDSVLWDEKLTWYTSYPQFTPCFQKTVLVWTPCAFLWVFGLAQILIEGKKKPKTQSLPFTPLLICKIVLSAALFAICFACLGLMKTDKSNYNSKADVGAAVMLGCTYLFTILILCLDKWKGKYASILLWIFWLFICGCSAFTVRYLVQEHKNDTIDNTLFNLYMVYFSILVVQWLLTCIPDRRHHLEEGECPKMTASALSRVIFTWMDSIMWKGFRNPLETKDMYRLFQEDTAANLVPQLEKHLKPSLSPSNENSKGQKKGTLFMALFKVFGPEIAFGMVTRVTYDIMMFINPQLLSLIIGFIEDKDQEHWKGLMYAVLMLFTASIMTLLQSKYFYIMMMAGMRIRSALCGTLYKKALLMNLSSRRDTTVGEIVNLMAVDAQRFIDVTTFFGMVLSAPIQVGLALYFISTELGLAVIAGVIVIIIIVPIQIKLNMIQRAKQVESMYAKDERAKMMSEILGGMKVLKLYAWEPSFEKLINKIRNKELNLLKEINILQVVSISLMVSVPYLVALSTFTTYIVMGLDDGVYYNILNPKNSFVCLSLINIMRFPLNIVPMLLTYVVQAKVAISRMDKYFSNENISSTTVTHHNATDAVEVKDGTFTWDRDHSPFLKDINLSAKKGSLVGVVGSVGAGKSSLMHALMGEMEKIKGDINVVGSLAYIPQQAWIQNLTVRDNITFGSPFEKKWYDKVIDACALTRDLEILSDGDQTEIGEKGINVSGGQKQRISLARSVYAKRDVYYLDDPLSAVDSHVGAHLFEKVIGPTGILNKTTRILVTHALTYLPYMDKIVVLRDGYVMEMGSFKELIQTQGELYRLMQEFAQADKQENDIEANEPVHTMSRKSSRESRSSRKSQRNRGKSRIRRRYSTPGSVLGQIDPEDLIEPDDIGIAGTEMQSTKLISEEEVDSGAIKGATMAYYFKAMKPYMFIGAMAGFAFSYGSRLAGDSMLSKYTGEKVAYNNGSYWVSHHDTNVFLMEYTFIGLGAPIFIVIGDLMRTYGVVNAARTIHRRMLSNILHCPMSFFDTTPIGRLVNRFSKDIDVIDTNLPQSSRTFMWSLWNVLGIIIMISSLTPIFLSAVIPIIIVFVLIQRFYVRASNQLRRLESMTRSPIYSLYGESISGVTSIRAYQCSDRFINVCLERVDKNAECYFPYIAASRWLGVRLETVANLIVFFAALFAVIGRDKNSGTEASQAGLSVSYALGIAAMLNWMVRLSSEAESYFVSVERCIEYTDIPQEPQWNIEETKPAAEWPVKGEVKFDDYSTKYREGRELVIKNISCTIKPGEKVGIVGRTGAGKSSLTLALFRIIEAAAGCIFVDGIDISTLGLHDLRAGITIIPQDPVLFSGTLRINLDPFDAFEDLAIWRALELAHLRHFTDELPTGLNHYISEGGENLSVGQRQLVCLARALLRKTKILILDEATAAVDLETDQLIQCTIRAQFSDCTIITIAHRLNTIMDYDKVMVLDQGCLMEFDSPENLLADENTIFHSMAAAAALV